MSAKGVDATVTPETIRVVANVPALTIRLKTNLWLWWAEIAIEREAVARRAREDALRVGSSHSQNLGELLSCEGHASLVVVSASAHALDALYGAVKVVASPPSHLIDAWNAQGAKRPARILETLKLAFTSGPYNAKWAKEFKWLFNLRDAALHFEESDKEPLPQPLGTHVSPERRQYGLESATRALDLALGVLDICTSSPKPPTATWAKNYRPAVERLLTARRERS
jgi:hypothetical protein